VDGVPVREGVRVEHVGGVVIGRIETGYGCARLLVRFGCEEFAIRPGDVRVVSPAPSLAQITRNLQALLRELAR
jgi:hypothetical protein